MGDIRPPIAAALSAFGLAITVTRPSPCDTPITTTGIWMDPLEESRPFGTDFQREDPRKCLGVARTSALPSLPRGTLITAPEMESGQVLTWRVDGYDRAVEPDLMRVIVLRAVDQ